MKMTKSALLVFLLLIVISSLYRVWDGRPYGFAPQIAMALFAGSVIKNKKLSFLLPILSMLFSDLLYQILYQQGLSDLKGFYTGQWLNYLLFGAITFIGFFIKKDKVSHIFLGSVAGAVFYFLASNFFNWIGGGLDIYNQPYPKTFDGLITCYAAGLPFFRGSLWATLFFNGIFFGVYYVHTRYIMKTAQRSA